MCDDTSRMCEVWDELRTIDYREIKDGFTKFKTFSVYSFDNREVFDEDNPFTTEEEQP